jgi:hypothetical protein
LSSAQEREVGGAPEILVADAEQGSATTDVPVDVSMGHVGAMAALPRSGGRAANGETVVFDDAVRCRSGCG